MYIMTTSDKKYTLKLTYIRLLEFNRRFIECYNPICADVYVTLQSVSSDERENQEGLFEHMTTVLKEQMPLVVVDWVMDCIVIDSIPPEISKKLKKELDYIKDKFDFDMTYVEIYYAFRRILDWSIKNNQTIQINDGE